MNLKLLLASCLLSFVFLVNIQAQPPKVYEVENTGSTCEIPELPDPGDLQNYPFLPDPFAWSDGSGRVDTFTNWECRRNEIKAEIENYEIGPKPNPTDTIVASFSGNTLTVEITKNGEILTLTSEVVIPEGDGPFPVVIGMNSPTGSLPSSLFDSVIQVPFMYNQVVTYSQTSNRDLNDPYYKLYPDLTYVGNYSAWAWGVSRLIDGIELVQNEMDADVKRIAVTGCSYAGKMALFSGAFDERVALTIAQESGGGGINSWRVSETIGDVEKIDNTNYSWFMESMKSNFQGKVGTLPYDHHELMAMVVPRALLVLGNPPYVWLGDESGYVSCKAVEEVYTAFEIPERFGFSFRSGHNHCTLPNESYSEVTAFVNKFLFNDTTVNTNIRVHDFYDVDYNKWINSWKHPADENAPVVNIEDIYNDTTLEASTTVTINAFVSDKNNDVKQVLFYNNNQKIAIDSIAPYSLVLENITPGKYFISAEAIDSQNLSGYSNVVNFQVKAPTQIIYKTATPPIIDGNIDNSWNNEKVVALQATNKLVGDNFTADNLSGSVKIVWDNSNVYLLADVTDDRKQNDSQNTYEDDNVEFYFDINNAKSTSYDANDVQYSFAWNDGNTVGVLPNDRSDANITYSIADTDKGYLVEVSIPWVTLQGSPSDGMEIGFDFMINDDDDGDGRDGKLSWNASEDQAWQDASYFGTVKLNGNEVLASVNRSLNNTAIHLYPNPAKTELRIFGLEKKFHYQIVNAVGKVHLTGISQQTIPIESLPEGLFIISLREGNSITNLSFIKN